MRTGRGAVWRLGAPERVVGFFFALLPPADSPESGSPFTSNDCANPPANQPQERRPIRSLRRRANGGGRLGG